MVRLPFADEIRVARAAAEAAQQARVALHEVEVSLRELEIRHDVLTGLGQPIDPADDRRRQHLAARRVDLSPAADSAGQRSQDLSVLLGSQHLALHQPGHEDTVAAIKVLSRERQQIWDELEPVWQRVRVVEPVVGLIADHVTKMAMGVEPALMAKRTASLLAGIASALGAIGFEVALPDPPAADPLALADTAVRLRELGQVLADDRDGLQKRLADHRRQYDELSAQILALTG